MKLEQIPPVIFALFVPFLRISDVCSLYLTGSGRLIHSLSDFGSTTDADFLLENDPTVRRIPNFRRLFPKLKRLSITAPSPLGVVSTVDTPLSYLPPYLEYLELEFFTARDWLFHSSQICGRNSSAKLAPLRPDSLRYEPLSQGTPALVLQNLKVLILRGGSHCGCWTDLRAFAPHLEHLELHNTNGFTREHISHLPPTLTELRLPNNSKLCPSDSDKLPRNLRVLELSIWSWDGSERFPNDLPGMLQSLPPLVSMNANFPFNAPSDITKHLPRTLTDLSLHGAMTLAPETIENLPSDLLVFRSDPAIMTKALLNLLPPRLERLETLVISEKRPSSISNPTITPSLSEPAYLRNLRYLTIRSNVTRSALSSVRILDSISFPSLEQLTILSPLKDDVIPFIGSLPNTLKVLSLDLDAKALEEEFDKLSDQETSLEFPPHLTELSLNFKTTLGQIHFFNRFERYVAQSKIQSLPPDLKTFRLLGNVFNIGDVIRMLPHGVRSVSVQCYKANDNIDWFMDLPQRLRRFSLESFHGPITPELLEALPSSLSELRLKGVSGISPFDLKFLPRSLTTLHMPDVHMSSEDLKFLPENLSYFYGSYSVGREWIKEHIKRRLYGPAIPPSKN